MNGSSTSIRNRKNERATGATEGKKKTQFTWQEVAMHNTAQSAWVIAKGKVYDVTKWVDRHPGGREMVLIHAGREITDTMKSYHPFSDKPWKVLAKYEIGELVGEDEFTQYKPDTGFYAELCTRVDDYFKKSKLNPKDPFPGAWRMAIVFMVAALSYYVAYTNAFSSFFLKFVAAAVFGVCQALPLLHVMHDSSHTAFSYNPSTWYLVGRFCMDWFAGACMVSWLHQHVMGHHVYTNVAEIDPDLPVDMDGDARRLFKRQVMKPMYKWQHIYLPPLYGILGLKFRVQDFIGTFGSMSNGNIRVNPHSPSTVILHLMSKSLWAFYRIYLPLAHFGMPLSQFAGFFLVSEFMTGYFLAFNFQVSHVSTECDFPNGDVGDENASEIPDEWAVSQVKSSLDYAHGAWWTTFFAGALNYQTVHHLFPSISQYHYPALAPIIMDVCKKHKIKYNVLPTFTAAFSAHVAHLKKMGSEGKPVPVHMG